MSAATIPTIAVFSSGDFIILSLIRWIRLFLVRGDLDVESTREDPLSIFERFLRRLELNGECTIGD